MKRAGTGALVVALGAASAAAGATDFRGFRLGDDCSGIPPGELARGARLLNAGEASSGVYLFAGEDAGHEATITYWCREGRLIRAAYLFAGRPRAQAFALYEAWRVRMQVDLGEAVFDTASPGHLRTMKEAGQPVAENDRHSAYWRTPDLEIHLSRYELPADGLWDVSVLYQPPPAVTASRRERKR